MRAPGGDDMCHLMGVCFGPFLSLTEFVVQRVKQGINMQLASRPKSPGGPESAQTPPTAGRGFVRIGTGSKEDRSQRRRAGYQYSASDLGHDQDGGIQSAIRSVCLVAGLGLDDPLDVDTRCPIYVESCLRDK